MTRLHRGDQPECLRLLASEATAELCSLFEMGDLGFRFKQTLYAHPDVKKKLLETHGGKCCYCEHTVTRIDVEHYRPKSHYYWLVYEWTNLLAVCTTCNGKKGARFQLRDEARRALSHRHSLQDEAPMLINPAEEEPEDLFTWDRGYVKPQTGPEMDRAKHTIDTLGLNDDLLANNRRHHLKTVQTLIDLQAFDELRRMSNGTFAGMVRDCLRRASIYW